MSAQWDDASHSSFRQPSGTLVDDLAETLTLKLTFATTTESARPLEMLLAISYGVVLFLIASTTLPSGSVT